MSEYNPQKVRDLLSYAERLNNKRGELINEMINLESYIDNAIAGHFCTDKNKRIELLSMMVRRLNFDVKLSVFLKLAEKHYKHLLEKYPDMPTHFRQIQKMRNTLAHLLLYTNLDTAGENLRQKQLQFLNADSEIKIISEGQIQQVINLAKQYVIIFRFIAT